MEKLTGQLKCSCLLLLLVIVHIHLMRGKNMPAVKPQIETMQNQSYINEYINKTLNPWKSSLLQTILS